MIYCSNSDCYTSCNRTCNCHAGFTSVAEQKTTTEVQGGENNIRFGGGGKIESMLPYYVALQNRGNSGLIYRHLCGALK